MSVEIDVTGLEELQKKLEKAVEELQGSGLLSAIRDSTMLVQRSAKINAPVDTGRLRSSITSKVVSSAGGGAVQGVVGSNVEYAPYVEQPGPVRGVGRRPYLEPALTENIDKIMKIFESMVQDLEVVE